MTRARRRESDETGHWLTSAAFVLAVAVVIARAMQLEALREPFDVQLGGEPVPLGPGPAVSLVLDLLACAPALLILLRRAIDPAFLTRTTAAHVLFFALAAWSAASTFWASDKFAAAVSAAHLVAASVLVWSVSQLVRDWWRLRFVAGACFGLLLAYVAHGMIYKFVELPDLRRSVAANWEQIRTERGWDEGSFAARQFRRKIESGEMIGFAASPNTYAATIVMLGVVTAGLALQRRRDRDEWGWAALIGAAMIPAAYVLWLTRSRAALATPVLAAALIAAAWPMRAWLARRRTTIFAIAVAGLLLVAAALVAHGIYHDTLLHDSLTFRWRYWVGAWRLFTQHPLLGAGWENFGVHYLGVRLPIASEEVRDPHNFIVRFFTETGTIGGALLVAWLLRCWWEMTAPADVAPDRRGDRPPRQPLRFILIVSMLAIAINVLAAVDLVQPASYIFLELLKRLLYLALIVVGLIFGGFRSSQKQELDDRTAELLLLAMTVAVAIFFIHNLIDFSMFEVGPMFVLAMLIGALVGARTPHPTRGFRFAILPAGIAWLAAIGFVAPVVIAEMRARAGDDALRAGLPEQAARDYEQAHSASWPANSDYARRRARALIYAHAPPQAVRAALDAAVAADPMNLSSRRLRANFELSLPAPDRDRAIADFEQLMRLNPNDVQARVEFAAALERFAQPDRAAGELAEALRLNDLLSPDEPKRLRAAEVERLRAEVQRLRSGATTQPG